MGLHEILESADPEPEEKESDNIGIKIDGKSLHRIMFADDLIVFARSPDELEKRLQKIKTESAKHGLHFNMDKTVIMRNQHAPSRPAKVDGTRIQDVPEAKYLGRTFRTDSSLESEILNRIRASWASYHNAAEFMKFTDRQHCRTILFANVLPAATYSSETWNAKGTDYAKLQRTIDAIWDAADAGEPPNIRNFIVTKKLKWAGHLSRQPAERWSHLVTMWDPRGYNRKRGRPKTRWSDEVVQAVKTYRSTMAQNGQFASGRRRIGTIEKRIAWSTIGKDRNIWKVLIRCSQQADYGSSK